MELEERVQLGLSLDAAIYPVERIMAGLDAPPDFRLAKVLVKRAKEALPVGCRGLTNTF